MSEAKAEVASGLFTEVDSDFAYRQPVPDGWRVVPLDSVLNVVRGISFPKTAKIFEPKKGYIACLRTANVQTAVEWDDLWFVPEDHVKREEQFVQTGDILISTANSYNLVGKVSPVLGMPYKSTLGAFIALLRPKEEIDEKFAYHQLAWSDTQDRIRSTASTTTNISNVSTKKLKLMELVVPPLEHQRFIVAEIEKQFSRLDEAVASLKRAKANLKRYKAAVLKAAVEGKLTEEWREQNPDVEPASKLLERILAERRKKWEEAQLAKMKAKGKEPKNDKWREKYRAAVAPTIQGLVDLPPNWVWASPEQLASTDDYALAIGPFGSNLKVKDYRESGVPLIFVRNIRKSEFGEGGAKYVSDKKAEELAAHTVEAGDVLITKMGDPPGDACLYPSGSPRAVITADCVKWRLHGGLSSRPYFVNAINSQVLAAQIRLITKGVAQQKVSLARFKTLAIPLPPEHEQAKVCSLIEEKWSVVESLENEVLKQLNRAASLRQSILSSAFSRHLIL